MTGTLLARTGALPRAGIRTPAGAGLLPWPGSAAVIANDQLVMDSSGSALVLVEPNLGQIAAIIADPIELHTTLDQMRFALGAGDERAELSGQRFYGPTETAEVAWSFVVEPGLPNTASFMVCGQWHPDDAVAPGASPSFAFELDGEDFRIVTRDDVGNVTERWSTPLVRGKVYNVVTKSKLGTNDGSGLVRAWVDSVQVVNVTGNFGPVADHYWKRGLYRGAAVETLVARYANMEIGTTDLSARIASPLPLSRLRPAVPARPLTGLSPSLCWSSWRTLRNEFGSGVYGILRAGRYERLTDQSGNGFNGNQGTAANRALIVDGITRLADFAVSNYFVVPPAPTDLLAVGAGYVCVAFRADTIARNQATFSDNNTLWGSNTPNNIVGMSLRSNAGGSLGIWNNDGTEDQVEVTGASIGAFHTGEYRHEGGQAFVRLDGGAWTPVASGDLTGWVEDLNIGRSHTAGTTSFDGQMTDFAMFASALDDATRNAIRAAFAAGVGLS